MFLCGLFVGLHGMTWSVARAVSGSRAQCSVSDVFFIMALHA